MNILIFAIMGTIAVLFMLFLMTNTFRMHRMNPLLIIVATIPLAIGMYIVMTGYLSPVPTTGSNNVLDAPTTITNYINESEINITIDEASKNRSMAIPTRHDVLDDTDLVDDELSLDWL